MIVENVRITIDEDKAGEFESAVRKAEALFLNFDGCRSFTLHRSIEHPAQYVLLVGWDHIDDHVVKFRGSSQYQQWRQLVGPFFASPPAVDHLEAVLQ